MGSTKDDMGATRITKDPLEPQKVQKKTLGDFEIDRLLGKGGMGEVFLARQKSLDRLVALKLLSKEMAKKPGFVERFLRECRSMAKLDHPNAVKVYAAETTNGLNYAAIEYIDGQSLQKWLDKIEMIPIGDAVHIVLRCADALRTAHDLNMIHRDIKPDNILLTKKGVVKLADFGLAKAVDDEDMSMTQAGTGLGTPLYMAPEQARDAKNVDKRADIYALGITLYHFVTGKLPFLGDTVVKLIMAKEAGKYESARKANKSVPEKLDMIIDKMIQKDKAHRYQTCDELIRDLESLGIESRALTFISGSDASSARRTVSADSPKSAISMAALGKTSADVAAEANQRKLAEEKIVWYVKHTNPKGQTVISKLSAVQIQQMLKGELLEVKSLARKGDKGQFIPLAQYPEFEDIVKKRIAKTVAQTRAGSMMDMYAKIEKEQKRRNVFRSIRGWFENMLGGVAFIVYLALLGGAMYSVYLAFPFAMRFIANQFGLQQEAKAPENPGGAAPPAAP